MRPGKGAPVTIATDILRLTLPPLVAAPTAMAIGTTAANGFVQGYLKGLERETVARHRKLLGVRGAQDTFREVQAMCDPDRYYDYLNPSHEVGGIEPSPTGNELRRRFVSRAHMED